MSVIAATCAPPRFGDGVAAAVAVAWRWQCGGRHLCDCVEGGHRIIAATARHLGLAGRLRLSCALRDSGPPGRTAKQEKVPKSSISRQSSAMTAMTAMTAERTPGGRRQSA